jgi:hypothetical protein
MYDKQTKTETISVLLPCPDYSKYAKSTELQHESTYGASLHDAVRLIMRTLCLDFSKKDCYDELLEVVTDNLDINDIVARIGTDVPHDSPEAMEQHRIRIIAAKAFVSEIITAADVFMARAMIQLAKTPIGTPTNVSAFHRLNEDTYRVDFTRTVVTDYDKQDNEVAPCPLETANDLDEMDLEESRGFVLMRSSQSTQSMLEQTAYPR